MTREEKIKQIVDNLSQGGYQSILMYVEEHFDEDEYDDIDKPEFLNLEEIRCNNEEIYNENGSVNLSLVKDIIKEYGIVSWDDETGEEDNELPFLIKIKTDSDEHTFKFSVKRGECIEATWEHRIWDIEIVNLKQIV